MPFIKMEAGKMTKEQKAKLITGFTDLASETLGIGKEHFTILIKENEMDNWGVGGEMLSDLMKKRP